MNKIINYALYVVPFYGVYDQFFKKHKGERSTLGIIGSGIYTTLFVVKLALLPAYVSKGIATKNWNPLNFSSEKVEKKNNKSLELKLDSIENLK